MNIKNYYILYIKIVLKYVRTYVHAYIPTYIHTYIHTYVQLVDVYSMHIKSSVTCDKYNYHGFPQSPLLNIGILITSMMMRMKKKL